MNTPIGYGITMGAVDKDGILPLFINTKAEPYLSKTAKSHTRATTNGNTSIVVGGKVFKLGINMYEPNPDFKPAPAVHAQGIAPIAPAVALQ